MSSGSEKRLKLQQ